MRTAGWVWAAGALLAGVLLVHPDLLSLRRVPGDPVDSRLIHAQMEHGYRAWTGRWDGGFWNPPFFHPARNTAVYTETLSGTLPVYAAWRLAGAGSGAAYALWMLSCTALNVAACFWLLKGPLGRSAPAAAFGSFLFSFGTARGAHLLHPQLLPGFFVAFSAGALLRLGEEGSPARLGAWAAAAACALAAQVWTCFYVAWFLALGLLLFLLAALAHPSSREALRGFWMRRRPFLIMVVVLAAALVGPFAFHSLAAARELGFRSYDEAEVYLPTAASWLWPGVGSRIYGALAGRPPFDRFPDPYEHAIGLGVVATTICVAGLWSLRRHPWGRALGLSGLGLVVLSLSVGGLSLWALVFLGVPGAGAIRVVARVANVLLLPAAVGGAFWLSGRGRGAAVLALLAVLEQARQLPMIDLREEQGRAESIAAQVDRNASAFLYSGGNDARSQVAAMWAALETGVPTLNGYSGNEPPGWARVAGPEARRWLEVWAARHGIDASRIQVIP